MDITVNGQGMTLPPGSTIVALLQSLGVKEGVPVAVEINREIIPRTRHGQHALNAGDVVEVVSFVGGG